ncbi:MAG: hypothetical protein KatS3mg110_4491 [Pirellulaceae bacterium]|nr:MAG: hypothetical protein KatS3mg110_4491 [Pirellulaceae bacterium]
MGSYYSGVLSYRFYYTIVVTCTVIIVFSGIISSSTYLAGEEHLFREVSVTIRSDFPGGNIRLSDVTGATVHLEPDLRNDRPWFYWYFEAIAGKPGRVTFVFPEKVAGFEQGAISYQGPALSTDNGRTWRWMGKRNIDGRSFYYDFSRAGERVRFAVTIPYVQDDLEKFLARHAHPPHLRQAILTYSRHGRAVELLQIGSAEQDRLPVLVTARHHAAETMASFVLEGFLEEALSDSAAGRQFREKYVLYAIPFVDKDGVEEGDQGKNRRPHDHNRGYGHESIYPEIRAIKALDEKLDFRLTLDFHCPTLVMEDHQVMYFVGARNHPPTNWDNVAALAHEIKKRLPGTAPAGPLVWLRPADEPVPMNSHYFGFKPGTIMAATLEFPFAPPGKATDPDSCRLYGRLILQAWVATEFFAAK